MVDRSKTQLMDFLDWAADKGMMKKDTVRSIKSACNTVLDLLDEEQSADVLTVDLATVFQRYENIRGFNLSQRTMQSYKQRVSYAIAEFAKYTEDRSSWKPSGGQRSTSASSRSKKSKEAGVSPSGHLQLDPNSSDQLEDAAQITHRFPLRRDTFVTISGIPFDVKKGEMVRLTSFLANLVASEEEELSSQPMLMASLDGDK